MARAIYSDEFPYALAVSNTGALDRVYTVDDYFHLERNLLLDIQNGTGILVNPLMPIIYIRSIWFPERYLKIVLDYKKDNLGNLHIDIKWYMPVEDKGVWYLYKVEKYNAIAYIHGWTMEQVENRCGTIVPSEEGKQTYAIRRGDGTIEYYDITGLDPTTIDYDTICLERPLIYKGTKTTLVMQVV